MGILCTCNMKVLKLVRGKHANVSECRKKKKGNYFTSNWGNDGNHEKKS
jgi:hypothetical protein